jgi:hypothetical protein
MEQMQYKSILLPFVMQLGLESPHSFPLCVLLFLIPVYLTERESQAPGEASVKESRATMKIQRDIAVDQINNESQEQGCYQVPLWPAMNLINHRSKDQECYQVPTIKRTLEGYPVDCYQACWQESAHKMTEGVKSVKLLSNKR